jgi:hypothetical protein
LTNADGMNVDAASGDTVTCKELQSDAQQGPVRVLYALVTAHPAAHSFDLAVTDGSAAWAGQGGCVGGGGMCVRTARSRARTRVCRRPATPRASPRVLPQRTRARARAHAYTAGLQASKVPGLTDHEAWAAAAQLLTAPDSPPQQRAAALAVSEAANGDLQVRGWCAAAAAAAAAF